jgi:glycosyltransferase involved in cell wall biosynthesis
LKSLILSFSDTGGAGRAAINIFKSLIATNIEALLYVKKKNTELSFVKNYFNSNYFFFEKFKEKINRNICKFENKSTFSYQSPSLFPTSQSKKLNNFDCDIIHLCWINEFLSIEDIGNINKPIVWSLCDMWPFTGINHYDTYDHKALWRKNNFDRYKKFSLDRWLINRKINSWKKPFNLVVPNQWMYDCVKDSKIMSNFNCNIIKWPIDDKIFFRKDKIISRKKFKLPENRKILIFGSSNGLKDKRKGWYYLKKAIEKTNTSFDLIILGTKRPKNFELKFKGNVFFIDKVNNDIELCNLYNSADSLVLPSINDNTPLISQEAQMCGLPIIAFDHNGISEIVNHKVTGYKAKSLDIISLKDGIDWVFQNLNHANLIKNSLQMSRNTKLKFIGNEYKKLYKNILNK